jgi:hypothetical protein
MAAANAIVRHLNFILPSIIHPARVVAMWPERRRWIKGHG